MIENVYISYIIDPGTATVIGAGISAAASGSSIAAGAKLNKKNRQWYAEQQEKQNAFNAQQAQVAYDRQRELLKWQNDYDSPVNQMQRYKAAGLNPALLAGNISAQGVSAPSVDSTSAGSVGAYPYSNAFAQLPDSMSTITTALQNMIALKNQSKLAESQVDKNVAEISNIEKDTEKKGSEIDVNKKTVEEKDANIAKLAADTDLSRKNADKVVAETNTLRYSLEKLLPADLKEKFSRIMKNMSDMRTSQQLTRAQCALFNQQIKGIIADINLKDAQKGYVEQQIDKYDRYMSSVIDLNSSQSRLAAMNAAQQDMTNKVTEDMFNRLYDDSFLGFGMPKSKFAPGKEIPGFTEVQMLMWQFQFLDALRSLGMH